MNISRWKRTGDGWACYVEDIADSGRRNVVFINVWDVSMALDLYNSLQAINAQHYTAAEPELVVGG